MLAIRVGARWNWVDKVVFAITHGEMGEHNLCSESSYNVISVIMLYIKSAVRAQMQVSLILL